MTFTDHIFSISFSFKEAQQENYSTRGPPAPANSGKANNEDGVSGDRPSSLPVSD